MNGYSPLQVALSARRPLAVDLLVTADQRRACTDADAAAAERVLNRRSEREAGRVLRILDEIAVHEGRRIAS